MGVWHWDEMKGREHKEKHISKRMTIKRGARVMAAVEE
jgi:hypothetical protein